MKKQKKEPLSTPVLPEQDWFFTFGSAHAHPNRYEVIFGTFDSARQQMINWYSTRWAFQYESAEKAGVAKYNLKQVER